MADGESNGMNVMYIRKRNCDVGNWTGCCQML